MFLLTFAFFMIDGETVSVVLITSYSVAFVTTLKFAVVAVIRKLCVRMKKRLFDGMS